VNVFKAEGPKPKAQSLKPEDDQMAKRPQMTKFKER